MEDPDIVLDLRVHNSEYKSKYDAFWDELEKLLQVEHTLILLTSQESFVSRISWSKSVLLQNLSSFLLDRAQSEVYHSEHFKVKCMVQ